MTCSKILYTSRELVCIMPDVDPDRQQYISLQSYMHAPTYSRSVLSI
jgi:hypothetical protein